MEKWMCIGSIGVAVIFFLLFVADLFTGFPFSGNVQPPKGESSPFIIVDIGGILGTGILAYLGWNAYRDVK